MNTKLSDVVLYVIATFLFVPLTFINYLTVENKKGYFRSTAINIDRFGNREFRSLFNKVLITENGYKFGNILETISSVLGKNEKSKTLSRYGRVLVSTLNKIDKNHCENSIHIFD